jgi:hypothetical protein
LIQNLNVESRKSLPNFEVSMPKSSIFFKNYGGNLIQNIIYNEKVEEV